MVNKISLYTCVAFFMLSLTSVGQQRIQQYTLQHRDIREYEKAEWDITLTASFKNPFDSRDIAVDMLLLSPSGKDIVLPCFYVSGDTVSSRWKARFAPQDTGEYSYHFRVHSGSGTVNSKSGSFVSESSKKPGFLHKNDFWTFKFDNGKLFRGIGENVGWESRKWENAKYTYDYLLPTLSKNGANFFRTWMCTWNMPLEWRKVQDSQRYKSTDEYFNPDGIKRMDELVNLADSLGLYIMLTMDWHGALISNAEWKTSTYNRANGGPASNPTEFFTSEAAQSKYKNKLRYIIARWGYCTSIVAFEFFNEIDNAAFTPQDSILIPHTAITQWHDEMGMYLKNTDPYNHMVTTSISHRDIMGLNSSAYLDFNQKHIYKHTDKLMSTLKTYTEDFHKPYVIGEFGYEWDWNVDFKTIATESDFDYKRGLWYGLFSPTPILPMTWWWEFFDERGMTSYFRGVREISDQMLNAGNGSFETIPVEAGHLEGYGVKCGDKVFVYLLNNTATAISSKVMVKTFATNSYHVQGFTPATCSYSDLKNTSSTQHGEEISSIQLNPKHELVLILTPVNVKKNK